MPSKATPCLTAPEAQAIEYLRREFGQEFDREFGQKVGQEFGGEGGGEGGGDLLGRLLEQGLIDLRAAERRAVRQRVAELQRSGSGRVEAMFQVAEEFCCSYEKIRSIIYCKLKNP